MRRLPVLTLTMLACSGTAWAQGVPAVSPERVQLKPEDVVQRIMTFDANRDGKVQRSELAERMDGLIAVADFNKDAAIDRPEILAASRRPPEQTPTPFTNSSVYGFGDEGTTISVVTPLMHIEGAIADLRLPPQTRARALAATSAYLEQLEARATSELIDALNVVLSPEQRSSVTRVLETYRLPWMASDMTRQPTSAAGRVQDMMQVVQFFGLTPRPTGVAIRAVQRFDENTRIHDEERLDLVAGMADFLSAEERVDLAAALQRRPIVQKGPTMPLGGLVNLVPGIVLSPHSDSPTIPPAVPSTPTSAP